jgi:glycerol-3-phosphate dehydrogenase
LDFLLGHAARYLTKDPAEKDVLSVFAGLRPLVASEPEASTSALSRDHTLHISRSGLLTITGGKWTTYRKMAEDTIEQAIVLGGLDARPCVTKQLPIHGYHQNPSRFGDFALYGTDATKIRSLIRENAELGEQIHPLLPFCRAEVIWAVRNEMARTVEDFLARRTRAILLDAQAAIEAASQVAWLMSDELNENKSWCENQIVEFEQLASNYLISKPPASAKLS